MVGRKGQGCQLSATRDRARALAAGGPLTQQARDPGPAAGFPALAPQSLSNQISRSLVSDILQGTYKPGDRLPSVDDLARRFGVSRPVIREALKEAAMVGMLHSRQGRRAQVADYSSWNHLSIDVMRARLETGEVADVLLELLELRRMIEIEAASLAARRATEDDVAAMRAALDQLEQALKDVRLFVEADIHFHRAILRATGNHLLPSLVDQMRPLLAFARQVSVSSRRDAPQASQAGHRAVFEAIERGDPDGARAAMAEHLSWTANLDFVERDMRLAVRRRRQAVRRAQQT
jgi:GntR family transcriptional repressor for pyruvate dehydrogenase complex